MATDNNNDNTDTLRKRLAVDFFAEHRLLRAIYNNPDFLEKVDIDILTSSSTKNVYRAMANLKKKGVPLTRDSLLQEYSVIDLNASSSVIDTVADESVKETCLTDILDQLADCKRRRAAVASLKDAVKTIENSPRISEEEWDSIDQKLSEAGNSLKPQSETENFSLEPQTTSEWCEAYFKEFEKRRSGKVYWFRHYMFDALVEDGPQPGEIGIIASASGSGKSTVCLNLMNNLIETGVPCAYYSLEMSAVTTMDRLLSKRLHIPYKKIKNPSSEDFEELLETMKRERAVLEANKLFRICESGDVSLSKLEKDVIRFQKESGCRYWIILVDLLSMIQDFTKYVSGANFAQGIEVAINKLSALAKKLGVHIIGVLQLNRAAEAGVTVNSLDDLEKLRPNRAQIKNAGAFLERARYVLTAFRKLPYAKLYLQPEEYQDVLEDVIELSIVKQNDGEIGETARGIFDGEYFDILPIEETITDQQRQDAMFA